MYIPPAFRLDDRSATLAVMRDNSFAVLVAHDAERLEITHLPLLVEERAGTLVVRGHVAKANPIVGLIQAGAAATAVFGGPHAYISPDWYTSADQVPTWNYVAVHASGRLSPVTTPDDTVALLADLSAENEQPLAPKTPWTHETMREGLMARMMKGILAFELPVERLEAKAKLSQNKSAEDVAGAVEALRARGGLQDRHTADWMAKEPTPVVPPSDDG